MICSARQTIATPKVNYMQKVFGIGWAKTGTTTLGRCFRILGYEHQSQALDLVRDLAEGDLSAIMALAENKQSFEDWPWNILYAELDEVFPYSRFILTEREPESWLRSYRNMLYKEGQASEELNEIRRILYDLPFPNVTDQQLVARYLRHNTEVHSYFQERPDDLLVVNWANGDGWNKICAFLNCKIPSEPFPHENRGGYGYRARLKRIVNTAKNRLKQPD